MDIDRMKALAGVKEAKKPRGSELSIWDMDGMTIGDLIHHLQTSYDPTDRISVEEEYTYSMVGGNQEPRDAIMIYPKSEK